MSFTTIQLKAIAWYCEQHESLPQMSAYPKVRFRNKATDEIFETNITSVVGIYKTHNREEAKRGLPR